MSLTTRCPTCGTVFRVVPDQLKLSDGWVRCGHCEEVFDANAHLTQEAPVPPGLARLAAAAPAAAAAGNAASASPPASADPDPAAQPAGFLEQAPDPALVYRRADPAEDAPGAVAPPEPAPEAAWVQVPPPPPPPGTPAPDLRLRGAGGAPAPTAAPGAPLLPDEDDLDALGFVRSARRRAFWQRPLVRAGLFLLALLLAAVLAGQWAWMDRDRLAVRYPQLVPALQQMCGWVGCRLRPPRQIEAIVIESSGFERVRGDAFQLNFLLRNTGRLALETPALELTLTDAQDQPVLRRVLTPAELGAPGESLPPGGDWSASVGLTVPGNGTSRITGYRLLAFYP